MASNANPLFVRQPGRELSSDTDSTIMQDRQAGGHQPDNSTPTGDLASGGGASGPITATALTMNTARILGRTTAGVGAIEEITVGAGLSLAAGALTATGAAVDFLVVQVFS